MSKRYRSLVPHPLAIHLSLVLVALASAPSFASDTSNSLPADAQQATSDTRTQAQASTLDAVQVVGKRVQPAAGALGVRPALDTPYSVRTVTREQIEERQVISVASAFFGDASVTPLVNDDGIKWSSSGVSVRGLALSTADSSKVDGLPMTTSFTEWPVEVVENIDLLKGPAGFMYGFGAPGGIINYVSKAPTDETTLRAVAGFRTSGIATTHVDVGGRFGSDGMFGYRFNAARDEGETYDGGNIDRRVLSLGLDARLSDAVTWDANWVWQDRMLRDVAPYFYLGGGVTRAPPAVDGDHDFGIDGPFVGTKTWSARTSLRWRIAPDWNSTISFGRSHYAQDVSFPYAVVYNNAGDYELAGYSMANVVTRNMAQAMVEGSFRTGPLQHEVVAGAYWMKNMEDVPLEGAGGCEAGCLGNLYTQADFVYENPAVGSGAGGAFARYADTVHRAAFISDTVEFLPGLSAVLGLRFNDYDNVSFNAWGDGSISSRYNKKPTTPTIALLYKPRESMTVYASYVESLEPGVTVGTAYLNAGEVLEAMVSSQYEAGFKLVQGRWSTDAALFRIDRAANIDRVTNAGRYLVQDGVTRYQGAEWSFGFRASDDWRLGGGVTWLDATYQELSPSNAANLGNRAMGTSRLQSVLQAGYTPSAIPELSLHAGVRYYGDHYQDAANRLNLPGYSLLSAGFGYRFEVSGHLMTLRAQLNNLTGKAFWSPAGIGAPRTLSINLSFDL